LNPLWSTVTGTVGIGLIRLAQATVRAAEAAAKAEKPIDVSNTSQLRDLAASAARIFGWDKTDKPGVQLNQQIVISAEQLQQIRQLREAHCEPSSRGALNSGLSSADSGLHLDPGDCAKRRSQRRSSPTSFFSPAEDTLKCRMT
jgi:hypothetical protein